MLMMLSALDLQVKRDLRREKYIQAVRPSRTTRRQSQRCQHNYTCMYEGV